MKRSSFCSYFLWQVVFTLRYLAIVLSASFWKCLIAGEEKSASLIRAHSMPSTTWWYTGGPRSKTWLTQSSLILEKAQLKATDENAFLPSWIKLPRFWLWSPATVFKLVSCGNFFDEESLQCCLNNHDRCQITDPLQTRTPPSTISLLSRSTTQDK